MKILALILMTIDHIGFFIFPESLILRYIGRLSAPLFLFCVSEGLKHTRSKPKYIMRLYIASVVMALMNMLMVNITGVYDLQYFGIFTTFIVVAVISYLIDLSDEKIAVLPWAMFIITQIVVLWLVNTEVLSHYSFVIAAIIPSALLCEGGALFVSAGVAMYIAKTKSQAAMLFAGISLYLACITLVLSEMNFSMLLVNYQWMMVFSAFIMLLYSGEKGKSDKLFFYTYYPLHIYILCWIAL